MKQLTSPRLIRAWVPALGAVPVTGSRRGLYCIDTSGRDDITVSSADGSAGPIWAGWGYRAEQGEALPALMLHGGAVGAWVSLLQTDGELSSSRMTGTVNAQITSPATLDTSADFTTTGGITELLVASLATRKAAYIQLLAGDPVHVGGPTVDDLRGIRLEAGQTLILETSADIWVYASAAQTISVTEVIE